MTTLTNIAMVNSRGPRRVGRPLVGSVGWPFASPAGRIAVVMSSSTQQSAIGFEHLHRQGHRLHLRPITTGTQVCSPNRHTRWGKRDPSRLRSAQNRYANSLRATRRRRSLLLGYLLQHEVEQLHGRCLPRVGIERTPPLAVRPSRHVVGYPVDAHPVHPERDSNGRPATRFPPRVIVVGNAVFVRAHNRRLSESVRDQLVVRHDLVVTQQQRANSTSILRARM